jgi:hypothetical protein
MLRVTMCSRDMKEWVHLDVVTLGEAVIRFPTFVVWYVYPVE